MKEINKLVHLVTHGLKSNFGVIDLSGEIQDPGKEQQLYNGVLNGQYPNDEVTSKGMYNANIYDQRFRMLKSRLRYKLYDLLYHIDFEIPHYSYTVQKKLECKSYLHKAQILYKMGQFAMSEKQYNKAIVLASECQFTTELIEANEIKRKVLAKEFKPTDFEQTLSELKELRLLDQKEKEAEDLFLHINMLLSKSIHSRTVNASEAEAQSELLSIIFKETNSINVFLYLYELRNWVYLNRGDFEGLINFLNTAAKEVENLGTAAPRFDKVKNKYLLAKSHLALESFKEGLKEANAGLKLADKSVNMWFELSEIKFLLCVHAKDYRGGYDVLTSVLKNPNFNRSSLEVINRWKIFKIYLNFAIPELGIQKRIRFYDIFEASEGYFRELKGYRMTLYLLEFMHLINKDNFEQADKKMDELESYFYKHLNDPGKNQREKQLMKMLKALRTTQYNVEETKTISSSYFDKMSAKKTINAFADFEIIPYEDIWNHLLDTVTKHAKVSS